jgi:excisionase family DNA binding protein
MRRVKTMKHPGKVAFLTLKQVLEWLPVSERTIRRYLDAGKLRAYKMDGLLLFNPADVEAFLKRRRVGGGPVAPFEDLPELNPDDINRKWAGTR